MYPHPQNPAKLQSACTRTLRTIISTDIFFPPHIVSNNQSSTDVCSEKAGVKLNTLLSTKNPAELRDQAAQIVKKLRVHRTCTIPVASPKQWQQLHEALNAEDTLKICSRKVIDQYDLDMREGLAILQLMVMEKVPDALGGDWSPLLHRIASCTPVVTNIVNLLLASISKKDLQ